MRVTTTVGVREVSRKFAGPSFILPGVATDNVHRTDSVAALKASELPARFWWDLGRDGKPEQIQAAWNARIELSVLDQAGVMRYRHVARRELFEEAVTRLPREAKPERKSANPGS